MRQHSTFHPSILSPSSLLFPYTLLTSLFCSHTMRLMKQVKLTRAQIKQGLEQTPMIDILGPQVTKALTPKQQAFAKNLASGDGPSTAYKKAFNRKGKPEHIANDAYKLRQRPDIIQMQEAYKAAIEGQRYQTPAALRALVIESLVSVIIDPEANHSQVVAAAKVLGTVTEVAAFTERKEVTTITNSEAARAKVMTQLREMMNSQADDATIIESEALSLEQELAGHSATPIPQDGKKESLIDIHTIPLKGTPIPLKRSPSDIDPLPHQNPTSPPPDDNLETPPA